MLPEIHVAMAASTLRFAASWRWNRSSPQVLAISEGRAADPTYGWCGDAVMHALYQAGSRSPLLNLVAVNGVWKPAAGLAMLNEAPKLTQPTIGAVCIYDSGAPGGHTFLVAGLDPFSSYDGNGPGRCYGYNRRDPSRILSLLDSRYYFDSTSAPHAALLARCCYAEMFTTPYRRSR